jgi:microcystin-dependent protein
MAILGATSLTGCNSIPDFIASGTLAIFQQTTAPTSWVKQTDNNDDWLRVVSGTAGSGGVTAFSSVFPSAATVPISSPVTVTGTVGNTTLTTPQIPAHSHATAGSTTTPGGISVAQPSGPTFIAIDGPNTNAGGGDSHTHPWSGTATSFITSLDLRVQYVDIIICSKS